MGLFKKLGKIGLGGIPGIVANKGRFPAMSGIGFIQRMGDDDDDDDDDEGMRRGGRVKKRAKGGSASSRADGCAQRGKTRGKMI